MTIVAIASKRSWVRLTGRSSAVAQANASVCSWKAAARPPASRTTGSNPAARAASTARSNPGRGAVLLREGELAGRAVEAEGRGEFTRRDPVQDRLGDACPVRAAPGKARADQPEQGFFLNVSVCLQV